MTAQPRHTEAEDIRYRKLSAIDTKCGSLLQLTSVLLVIISLPPIFETVRPKHEISFKLLFTALLLSCTISLFVLYFREHTTERFVDLRKYALNIAVCLTGICCLVVTAIVLASL